MFLIHIWSTAPPHTSPSEPHDRVNSESYVTKSYHNSPTAQDIALRSILLIKAQRISVKNIDFPLIKKYEKTENLFEKNHKYC